MRLFKSWWWNSCYFSFITDGRKMSSCGASLGISLVVQSLYWALSAGFCMPAASWCQSSALYTSGGIQVWGFVVSFWGGGRVYLVLQCQRSVFSMHLAVLLWYKQAQLACWNIRQKLSFVFLLQCFQYVPFKQTKSSCTFFCAFSSNSFLDL